MRGKILVTEKRVLVIEDGRTTPTDHEEDEGLGREAGPQEDDREIFDREDLLETLGGDSESLARLVALFVEDLSAQVDALRTALEAGEPDAVESHAHRLKGAAANMRAGSMSRLFAEMEQTARRGELGRMPALLEKVGGAFEAFRRLSFSGGC